MGKSTIGLIGEKLEILLDFKNIAKLYFWKAKSMTFLSASNE